MAKKKASNTINGKAFEYACLRALLVRLSHEGVEASPFISPALSTAQNAYGEINQAERERLDKAAATAANLIIPLEPKLLYGKGKLSLSIAADSLAIGLYGDVRDVFCSRMEEKEPFPYWKIGISCKHNHEALRHPRITEGKDFGKDWLGIYCSREFMDEITPVIDTLVAYGSNRVKWSSIQNKYDGYYVPILNAYLKEIKRLCDEREGVPEKLLSYFFGAYDFYKVIMRSASETTTIECFNMHGTLNQPCGKRKAMIKVPIIKMPTRLIDAAFKINKRGVSKTTIVLTFDQGWSISMRLHNKDDIAKPTSLAWDVKLEGLPPSTYINTHSWNE